MLVGHDRPKGIESIHDDRLTFIQADWPPPNLENFWPEGMEDKWGKVRKGFVHASGLNTDYIMIVDADDLVSNKIPEFLHLNKPENGYIFKNGYLYEFGRTFALKRRGDFNCGTNAVLRTSRITPPKSNDKEDVGRCIGLTAGHTIIERRMQELGMPLEPAPFYAAVHVTHREQHSGAAGRTQPGAAHPKPRLATVRKYIRQAHRLTFFGRAKRREFGLQD